MEKFNNGSKKNQERFKLHPKNCIYSTNQTIFEQTFHVSTKKNKNKLTDSIMQEKKIGKTQTT